MDHVDSDPLKKWSDIQNQQTAHALAAAAYRGILARIPQTESFVAWLLGGTAATAGLIVANIATVTEALGRGGVQWLLYSIVASVTFGLLARSVTIFIPMDGARIQEMRDSCRAVLEAHGAVRDQIEEAARVAKRNPPPNFQIQMFVTEYQKAIPFIAKIIVLVILRRQIKRGEINLDLHIALRGWSWLTRLCFLQVADVLTGLVSVAVNVLGN